MKKEIVLVLKELLADSTVHGIPRLVRSKSFLSKLVWLAFFIISCCYCVYLIFETIFDFFEYNTIISFDNYPEVPSLFPAITICNLNPFQSESSLEIVQKIQSNNTQINGFSKNLKFLFVLDKFSMLNDSEKKKMADPFNETLISCRINNYNCTADDFQWKFVHNYGNCYRFNSGTNYFGRNTELKHISKQGKANGLSIELFIGNPNRISELIETSGIHVFIDNQTEEINPNSGFDIAAATQTDIVLQKFFIKKQPKPFSACQINPNNLMNSHLFLATISNNKTYSQANCVNLCLQQIIINKCRCYNADFEKLNGEIPCDAFEKSQCLVEAYDEYMKNMKKLCLPYCPLECDHQIYQKTITFTKYPTRKYAEQLLLTNPFIQSKIYSSNRTINYELIKESVLSFNIYYEDLSYVEYRQSPKTRLADLISNIGGIVGVFIGASFLSFVEIVECAIELVLILKSAKKHTKQIQPMRAL